MDRVIFDKSAADWMITLQSSAGEAAGVQSTPKRAATACKGGAFFALLFGYVRRRNEPR
jgi:hypothetical protein